MEDNLHQQLLKNTKSVKIQERQVNQISKNVQESEKLG